MAGPPLNGFRVLVVEDEWFLADDIAQELESCGAKIVGPIADLGAAREQVRRDDFDVAVIDVRLRDRFAGQLPTN